MNPVDRFINAVTMYRLTLYGLGMIVIAAFGLSLFEVISYDAADLLVSLLLCVGVCFVSNFLFSKLRGVPANRESWLITALILFLIVLPGRGPEEIKEIVLAGTVAMASKYFLSFRGKHLFNPAAFGAVMLTFLGSGGGVWWVGTQALLPVVLLSGILVVRKIRRSWLFLSCILASVIVAGLFGFQNDLGLADALRQHFLSWPIVFFAAFMVTEPFTTPPRLRDQVIYGIFVGAVSSWPFHLGTVYSTPELTLLIANLFSYAVSFRRRLELRFEKKNLLARDTYEFIFSSPEKFYFRPGQYMEWTLPHRHADSRGVRRYFTVASSPTEGDVRLGVRIGSHSSSFKKRLQELESGEIIYAGNLAGDFVLSKNPATKLVFIAGGIGITPFRSMIAFLLDAGERRDIVLFYCNRTREDIAYGDLLEKAGRELGLKVIHILNQDGGKVTVPKMIDAQLLQEEVPDYSERFFYLSGPSAMVDAYKALILTLGVPRRRVVTDYFPGF